jgi:branched-chain amino acid transport system substrate-binding protein
MPVCRVRNVALSSALLLLLAACSSSSKSPAASPSGGSSTSTGGAASATSTTLPNVKQEFTATGPLTASAPGITPTSIKIGFVTSETGPAASTFKDGAAGAKARVALQNAQGGIDGRQIQLVTKDDASTNNKAAVQDLVENDHVFGVIDISAFGLAAPYLNQNGIPVTGIAIDGPEWGQQPNTNMFTPLPVTFTPFDGHFYTYDGLPQYLKSLGVTKIATLGYGISPSSIASNKATISAMEGAGIKNCYENEAVQFGQTSFTTEALAIQKNGCDGVLATMVDASDVGLSGSLKQAGISVPQFFYTGYDQNVLDDPNASAALDGSYFVGTPNYSDPTPGTQGMLSTLAKYSPKIKGIPSLGVFGSYAATDTMIEGLSVAGTNPTRQSFIANLRKVSGYTAHGLSSSPLNFTGFGTVAMLPTQACGDYVQLKDGKFVTNKKNVCGKLVKTSATG